VAQNFLPCDRDQELLLPPSLREWLPEDHLAWFVLDAVEEIDLSAFYGAYRDDGWGRAAFEPAMMVALLLYAYAVGERSSRGIERRCREDVAFRVITANRIPDHATIARFRARHEEALAGLFGQVLRLCGKAGIVDISVVAVDGTKLAAAASDGAIRTYEQIAAEILAEAGRIDAAEDEINGDARGDELPEGLRTPNGRRAWLREAKEELKRERAERPEPVPRARAERLETCRRRLAEDWRAERRANRAYEAYRARGRMKDGRRFGRPPDPYQPPATPEGRINVTDPDSRVVKGLRGFLQGYNAQAVTNEHQVVLAAEIETVGADFGHLEPMLDAAQRELGAAGVNDTPEVLLADAGYWHGEQMQRIVDRGIQVLIPPDTSRRRTTRRNWDGGRYDQMRQVLASDRGSELYRKRQPMIEPVFAQMKFNRGLDRFRRRGRGAVRAEWRLITATHNLLKLHRHALAAA
jgi:transposase